VAAALFPPVLLVAAALFRAGVVAAALFCTSGGGNSKHRWELFQPAVDGVTSIRGYLPYKFNHLFHNVFYAKVIFCLILLWLKFLHNFVVRAGISDPNSLFMPTSNPFIDFLERSLRNISG
jgi:hypothetical protein